MKKLLVFIVTVCCFLLTACSDTTPPDVLPDATCGGSAEKIQFGKQYEKKPIRMFNVDGELYYDSGLVSDMTPRCGTLDGNLKKAVDENEIPLNSGDANFEAEGYQNATSITKEVSIDGEWVIFKKYRHLPEKLKEYKYCFYIKGYLNNAVADSEMVVLTDDESVTFHDVVSPMLSIVTENEKKCRISHESIAPSDKWGVYFYAEDITSKGLTLKIEQFGGTPSGELQTGAAYFLETTINDEWQTVETKTDEPLAWNDIAYSIAKNDITEMKIDWQYAYGELKPGYYRLKKELMDFRDAGDYDKEIYEVYFTVE